MASLIPDQNIPFFFKLNQKLNNFKQLLIIIAAVVLVGCGALENYEGKYFFEFDNVKTNVELKQNSVVTLQEGIDKPMGLSIPS